MIEPGDKYLADKGFEVHYLVAFKGATLFIPLFKCQANDQI